MVTEDQFVQTEIAQWGEDYVYDLIDRGYEPVLTTQGYKWLLTRRETAYTTIGDSYDDALRYS